MQKMFFLFLFILFFSNTNSFSKSSTVFIDNITIPNKFIVKKDLIKKHLVDVVIDTNKYELSFSSLKEKDTPFGKSKFKEKLLKTNIEKSNNDIIITTKLGDKTISKVYKTKSSSKKLLVAIRLQLYELILGKKAYSSKKEYYSKHSLKRINRLSPNKKRISVRKSRIKIKKLKKKLTIKTLQKRKVNKVRLKKNKYYKKRVLINKSAKAKKLTSKKVAKKVNTKSIKTGNNSDSIDTSNWPNAFFSAGIVVGQKLTDIMSDSQGQPLFELGIGAHHLNSQTKLYLTYSRGTELVGLEKSITQTNLMFNFSKGLHNLNSLPYDLKNIVKPKREAASIGTIFGIGRTSISGELISTPESILTASIGTYITLMGLINIEGRYQKSLEKTSVEVSKDGDFSSFIFKISIGYPM